MNLNGVDVSELNGWTVIKLTDDYDSHEVMKAVERITKKNIYHSVCLDLSCLKVVTSSDIRMILILKKRINKTFAVCVKSDGLKSLKTTNIDKIVKIDTDLNNITKTK